MAVNFSVLLEQRGISCTLVDLDFSKGDFTLRSSRFRVPGRLFPLGERAPYAETPVFAQGFPELFARAGKSLRLVVDLGRDERGLRLFRSLHPFWGTKNTHVVLVVNFARPFFEEVSSYVGFVETMRARYSIPLTSLVANTHLMRETDAQLLEEGWRRTVALGTTLGLPILFASLWEEKKEYYGSLDWRETAVFAVSRFLSFPWGEED